MALGGSGGKVFFFKGGEVPLNKNKILLKNKHFLIQFFYGNKNLNELNELMMVPGRNIFINWSRRQWGWLRGYFLFSGHERSF